MAPGQEAADSSSIWEPMRIAGFRALWISGALYFIGNALQSTTAAWTMLVMTDSPFLSALVQTAVFLPMFALVLPAGVLADTSDRQRLMLRALFFQACASGILAALHFFHQSGPAALLCLIFVSGCCTAMLSPAWNATVADYVPRAQMVQAITALGVAYNAARAAGPALAGVLIASAGGELNFLLAVAGDGFHFYTVRKWPPLTPPPSQLPPERLWGGTIAALRFTWHSELVFPQLLRVVAFSSCGAALWALLPAIGQRNLGLGAAGYGMLTSILFTQ